MATRPPSFPRVFAFGFLILVAGLAVWFVTKDSDSATPASSTNEQAANTSTEAATSVTRDERTDLGYAADFPAGWQVSVDTSGDGDGSITNVTYQGDEGAINVGVMSPDLEGVVRESLSVRSEESVTVSGVTGKQLDAATAKEGEALTIVLLTHGGKLYEINGDGGETFDAFLNAFTFTNQLTP